MTKPAELSEAEMVYRMTQVYQSLPETGGILDQSVEILRMHNILAESGYFGDTPQKPEPESPLAGLPMEVMG